MSAGDSPGRLAGLSVLVVGASSGLGRALACAAAAEGAVLTLGARRVDALDQLASACPGEVLTMHCDVSDPDDCAEIVERCASRFGRIDVLVYAAGSSPLGSLTETTPEEWATVFQTNTIGAAQVTACAAPHLRARHGRALFMSSASAHAPKPGLIPYGASKRALEAIIEGFRLEEPDIAYTTVIIASTGQTDFTSTWDPQRQARYREIWQGGGLLTTGAFPSAEAFASLAVALLSADIAVPEIYVGPFPPGFEAGAD
jgi:NAD(P)-dependent dehydrogenase (short-subunit alcohol dehydrogenase family)